MINLAIADFMSEECIQNYQKFLARNKADGAEKGFYALENIDHKNRNELFPSIKIIDRRQQADPTYQGYYALEMLDRRKTSGAFIQNSQRIEWVKFRAEDLLGDGLF
jgi:hypothetical protein